MPGSSSTIRMRGRFMRSGPRPAPAWATARASTARDLDGEARAGRAGCLRRGCARCVGEDVVHDGEPEAGAAALGGEVGQEQFLLIFGRDAAAGVGDDQLDRYRRRRAAWRCTAASPSESCMASAALSTRLTTTRLNCSRSTLTGGRPGARSVRISMPSSRPAKTARALSTTSFRSQRDGLGGGEARELRELVDQAS